MRFAALVLTSVMIACSATQDFTSSAGSAPSTPADLPACGDLANDPNSCGACGHSCLGGACIAGACQPVQLTTAGSIGAIAIDETSVYYADTHTIARVPINGGDPVLVATFSGELVLNTLVLDDGYLYIAYTSANGQGTIGRVPATGGKVVDLGATCGSAIPEIFAFTVKSGVVAFTCEDAIYTCPTSGCAAPHTLDAHLDGSYERASVTSGAGLALALGHPDASAIALHVYALDGSSQCTMPFGDARERVSPETAAVAVDGLDVFVASLTTLYRTDTHCTTTPVTLTDSKRVESAVRLVTNDASLIWGHTYLYDGAILRCPKTGCAEPEVLASGLGAVEDVATTNDVVYWVTTARVDGSPVPGTVMKLALAPSNVPPWKGH